MNVNWRRMSEERPGDRQRVWLCEGDTVLDRVYLDGIGGTARRNWTWWAPFEYPDPPERDLPEPPEGMIWLESGTGKRWSLCRVTDEVVFVLKDTGVVGHNMRSNPTIPVPVTHEIITVLEEANK